MASKINNGPRNLINEPVNTHSVKHMKPISNHACTIKSIWQKLKQLIKSLTKCISAAFSNSSETITQQKDRQKEIDNIFISVRNVNATKPDTLSEKDNNEINEEIKINSVTALEQIDVNRTDLKLIAPPLENFGNTCFINTYISGLMYSLNEQHIESLEKLTPDTIRINSAKFARTPLGNHTMEVRDAIVALWKASRQRPSIKNVISKQRDLLCALIRCGNAHRSGDKGVPSFFNTAFPAKTEKELANPDFKFDFIKQQDCAEFTGHMNTLLMNNIYPEETFLRYDTVKFNHQKKPFNSKPQITPSSQFLEMHVSEPKPIEDLIEEMNTTEHPKDFDPTEHVEAAGIDLSKADLGNLNPTLTTEFFLSPNTQTFCLSLNLFRYNLATGAEKINEVAIQVLEKSSFVQKMKTPDQKTHSYRLNFLRCHVGETPNSGHYFGVHIDDNDNVIIHDDRRVGTLKDILKLEELNPNLTLTEYLKDRNASPYMWQYKRIE
ncbi:MAG: hypothetical protein OXC48_11675 [Endozoicomonadaceae bacterium]|nr:hypothetical protein [Endozoicomonadaceae bacterium]